MPENTIIVPDVRLSGASIAEFIENSDQSGTHMVYVIVRQEDGSVVRNAGGERIHLGYDFDGDLALFVDLQHSQVIHLDPERNWPEERQTITVSVPRNWSPSDHDAVVVIP